MREISGKRALVTGGAKGIGRAIAVELARQGADVCLFDNNVEAIEDAASQCKFGNNDVITRCCDISETHAWTQAVSEMLHQWGTLDILVNNAGICFYGPTEQMLPQQLSQQLHVNLLAPLQLTQKLLPHLLSRPSAHILNVASFYGLFATDRCAIYHATKFGLVGFSEALRAEYGRHGLGVTALCPGFVRTDLFESMPNEMQDRPIRRPPKWLCTSAEQVAVAAVRGIKRNRRLVLVSPFARLLYLQRRVAPGLLDFIYRFAGRRKRYLSMSTPELFPPSADNLVPLERPDNRFTQETAARRAS